METLEALRNKFSITLPIRRCLMYPGRTESKVYEVRGDELVRVEPSVEYSSKTGAHGEVKYVLDKDKTYIALIFERSNTGKHYVTMKLYRGGQCVLTRSLSYRAEVEDVLRLADELRTQGLSAVAVARIAEKVAEWLGLE